MAGCLLSACTGAGPGPRAAASSAPPTTATAPASAAPTGTAQVPAARPLAATVALDGPPQVVAGLGAAGTIVEHPLPAGDTGAVAITHRSPPALGPLRPASAADARLALLWGADMVTTVAPPGVVGDLRAAGLAVVEEGPAGAVLRDPARRAPFNTYAVADASRSAARREVADGATPAGAPWRTGTPPAVGGEAVEQATVRAGPSTDVLWSWDGRAGRWRRSVDGDPTLAVDGAPVTVGTVVVVQTPSGGPDELDGAGFAAVLRAGRRYAARWQRDGPSGALGLEQRDGTTFPVDDTVWLHLCAAPCARGVAPAAPLPARAPR